MLPPSGEFYNPAMMDASCSDYWYFLPDSEPAMELEKLNGRRVFDVCVTSAVSGNNYLKKKDVGCSSYPTLTFDSSKGDELRICVGFKNGWGYASMRDDSSCSNFLKTFMVSNTSLWNIQQVYVDTFPSQTDHRGSYCLDIEASSLTTVDKTVTTCSTGALVKTFTDTHPEYIAKQAEYTANKQSYNKIIDYCFSFPGNLWLRGLKLIVMPLLVANIITSVAQLRETSASGSVKLAWMTALYYLGTTVCAAVESLILVGIVLIPNVQVVANQEDLELRQAPTPVYLDTGSQIKSVFNSIIPKNIVASTMGNNYLGIIFFSITIGAFVNLDSSFLKFFSDLNTMMLRLVRVLVLWTPLGVFLLVTYALAYHDLVHLVSNVGLFLGTVILGLLLHLFVVYPLIYFTLTRKNPWKLLLNIVPAMVTALSVSSSIATYPYTYNCAVMGNKFNDHISKFVLTLGATINMDGTTIGFPVAVVFVAYAQGYVLGFGQLILIVILSTVSSMGAAPVPQAGLVLLIVIIESLGIPLGPVFSLIIAVDWLYDRPETMINICGDSFAAGIMDHFLREEFEKDAAKKDEDEALTT